MGLISWYAAVSIIAGFLLTAALVRPAVPRVQHTEAHSLYILTEGSADVLISQNQREQRFATLEAPTIVGEMGLMTGEPRNATVRAPSPVHSYRLFRDSFKKILSDRPELVGEISRMMATRDIELRSAREQLDADARQAQIKHALDHLLTKISTFFGLSKLD